MATEDKWAWRVVGSVVDRNEALTMLPEDYGVALRLRDDGQTPAEIATRLGVDEEVIATLLEIGDGKLRRILEAD